ncbi:MAG: hypothetical protein M5U11_17015 [Anaerolineales bacterium]|jgi:hypothetical protein|nr:hypothetical protein [Anaerolineales bacterium]MDX9937953.1 hypothetical protein [Anaerolineales bacterium]GER79259.1 hypothetical protein DIM_13400 [Candidatus Denitrolinea symbiosum]
MEVGNALFGISRGEFPIERGEGFEEELFRLFDVIAPDDSNSWRVYGMDFENDVFSVFPYYWAIALADLIKRMPNGRKKTTTTKTVPLSNRTSTTNRLAFQSIGTSILCEIVI